MSIRSISNSPEMLAAISSVCRDPATKILLEFPNLDIGDITSVLEQLICFLRENFENLGENEYLLKIDFNTKSDSSNKLHSHHVRECLQSGANIIGLDRNLKVINHDKLSNTSASSISAYSRNEKCCLIHIINGIDLVVYAKGLILKEMNANNPYSEPLAIKKFARNARDYKISIIECYQKRIRFSQYSSHWADRAKRILCGGRKTEQIFHDNLRNWLDENLNGASVFGNVKKVSNDETDIEIRLYGGSFYIIEVKWLGYNGSTNYSEPRLAEGINQVRNYLIRDPATLEACLVVFDGRHLSEFRELGECCGEPDQWKEVRKCLNAELPERGIGYVFFLENEDASRRQQL